MIKIGVPYIEKGLEFSRIICDILIDNTEYKIWFQVEKEYEKYLCVERADAYVIGLLNYAMRNNHDIYCEIPVTEELLYAIETDLIPSLSKHGKNLHAIKIVATIAKTLEVGEAVGTGLSCGIDSFSAVYNHIDTKYNSHNLTHLCINNVGAFNECYDDYGIDAVRKERYDIAEQVAKELGIKLIKTDSNFSEIYQNHYLTNTYSGVFAIYILQKFWKIYFLGSVGEDYASFSLKENDLHDSAEYDLLSLQCFSTSGLKIYSEGGAKTRLEKTKDLVDFKVAQKYLHVCTAKPYNCGVCSKCRRTLVTLDLLDKLDNFDEVFDVIYYKKNRSEYYKWLCLMHFNHDKMNEPVYQGFMNRKEGFKLVAYGQYVKNVILFPFRCCVRVLKNVGRKVLKKEIIEQLKIILKRK